MLARDIAMNGDDISRHFTAHKDGTGLGTEVPDDTTFVMRPNVSRLRA